MRHDRNNLGSSSREYLQFLKRVRQDTWQIVTTPYSTSTTIQS